MGAVEKKAAQIARVEFIEKNALLAKTYQTLSPIEFYDILFGEGEEEKQKEYLYVIENETYRTVGDIGTLLEISSFRSDVYIPPATFFRQCYKLVTLKQLYAFVVDIDGLEPEGLELLIRTRIDRGKLRPTLIMNSGQGVHLYYVFTEPIDCYDYRKNYLKTLMKALQGYYLSSICRVDSSVTLIQPYRVAGSRNKFGQTTIAYRSGEKVDVKKLAKELKVKLWNQGWKRSSLTSVSSLKSKKIEIMPNADRPFYEHVLRRIPEETQTGHRYTALFSLAIIAYKCRVPKKSMIDDLKLCQRVFNMLAKKRGSRLVTDLEVEKAMKGYSKEFVLVSSSQLEEWLGFLFPRETKRNGRKREEHLKMMNDIRQARTSRPKARQIKSLLEQGKSRQEIAEIMNISLSSTYKTYAKYFQQEDERLNLIKQYLVSGMKPKDIMDKMDLSKALYYKLVKKMKESSILECH